MGNAVVINRETFRTAREGLDAGRMMCVRGSDICM